MTKEERAYDGKIWTEFYIEFLGSLVPGLLALILSFIVLGLSLPVLCRSLQPQAPALMFPQSFDFGLGAYGVTGILLVASYVLGSIFYRQDPKIPDWKSASRVYRKVPPAERERLAVQPTSLDREGPNTIQPNDAQFPYFFLYEYLEGRGLDHLAAWVPWKGKDRATWKFRTKMFINQIKIRLQYLVPEHCKDIVRNEAHVRMATSVWYSTQWIMAVCGLGLLMLTASVLRAPIAGYYHLLPAAIFADVAILAFAFFLKWQIENFIHYLRVREIVYVLETAHFAVRNGINLHREDIDARKEEGSASVPQEGRPKDIAQDDLVNMD